jgi:hypothetical protein
MFKLIPYKKKLSLLYIALGIILIVSCRLNFQKTIEKLSLYQTLEKESLDSVNSSDSAQNLERTDKYLNELFRKYHLDSIENHRNILSVVSEACADSGLQLKEYRPYSICKVDSIQVLTRLVTVEGTFVSCLRLLYKLEKIDSLGRICSVTYKKYTDAQTKKEKLDCTLFVQNLIVERR